MEAFIGGFIGGFSGVIAASLILRLVGGKVKTPKHSEIQEPEHVFQKITEIGKTKAKVYRRSDEAIWEERKREQEGGRD